MPNKSSHRQTNKVKILAAIGVHLPRYSNFKVFPVYVMCPQFEISAEIFFFSIKLFKRFLSIDETSRIDCFILFANIRISSIGSINPNEPIQQIL